MGMPQRWVVMAAGCAIVAVAVERLTALGEPRPAPTAVAGADATTCPPARTPPPLRVEADEPEPTVAQPGGIDPLGASRAIREALEDCP